MDQQDDRPLIPSREGDGTSSTAQSRHAGMLLGSTLAGTLAALTLLAAPLVSDAVPALAASCLAGVLLLASAGFAAALLLVQARTGETRQRSWPQPALAIGGGFLVGSIVLSAWRAPTTPPEEMLLAIGGGTLVLAFPVLVLERSCAAISDAALAEAAGLTALLRAVLLVQIALGLALMLQSGGFTIAALLVPACAVLVMLVAAEFVLRGVAAMFLPPISRTSRRRQAWWPPVSDFTRSVSRRSIRRSRGSGGSIFREAGRSALPAGRCFRSVCCWHC